jgi:hypothetical protein
MDKTSIRSRLTSRDGRVLLQFVAAGAALAVFITARNRL